MVDYAIKVVMDTASGIVVDGVSYSYGSTVALDAVSMSASPGRFTALVGLPMATWRLPLLIGRKDSKNSG